jgi:hypothetical protein
VTACSAIRIHEVLHQQQKNETEPDGSIRELLLLRLSPEAAVSVCELFLPWGGHATQ